MLQLFVHVVTPALLLSDGGALVPMPKAAPASEGTRLKAVRRAARDGMCTNQFEEAAIAAVGGEFAATYGELTPRGFSTLATHIGLMPEDRFVDCGSGLGRLVVQAAREYGCCASAGIEYAASRHDLAVANLKRQLVDRDDLDPRVALHKGDCADADLWRAGNLNQCTVAFAANLLFDDSLNARLKRCLEEEATALRCVASLKAWPNGIQGFSKPTEVRCETSWSAPLVVGTEGSLVPHEGTVVYVYERET
jgi:hypothetical protein